MCIFYICPKLVIHCLSKKHTRTNERIHNDNQNSAKTQLSEKDNLTDIPGRAWRLRAFSALCLTPVRVKLGINRCVKEVRGIREDSSAPLQNKALLAV